MVSEKRVGKIMCVLEHASGPALENGNLHFETLMHTFLSISSISPNFTTIRLVVTENLSGQNVRV